MYKLVLTVVVWPVTRPKVSVHWLSAYPVILSSVISALQNKIRQIFWGAVLPFFRLNNSLQCRRILGGRKLVHVRIATMKPPSLIL